MSHFATSVVNNAAQYHSVIPKLPLGEEMFNGNGYIHEIKIYANAGIASGVLLSWVCWFYEKLVGSTGCWLIFEG